MSRFTRRMNVLAILLVATPISIAQEAPNSSCVPTSGPPRKFFRTQSTYLQQGPIEIQCGSQTVNLAPPLSDQRSKQEPTESTLLQWIEGLAKLASSLAWPLFGLIVLFTFRSQFSELIGRIKSIELGKNKVVLENKLTPIPALQQAAKSREEREEREDVNIANRTMSNLRETSHTRYFLAEDLALRALQDDYGVSIRRQVTAGNDPGFDGAFVVGDRLYIVEVKYYRSSFLPGKLQLSISRLAESINHYGWSNVQIILAAVFEELDDASTKRIRLSKAVRDSSVPVVVRTFSMAELNARFGLPLKNDA